MYLFGGIGCAVALYAIETPLAEPIVKAERRLIGFSHSSSAVLNKVAALAS